MNKETQLHKIQTIPIAILILLILIPSLISILCHGEKLKL